MKRAILLSLGGFGPDRLLPWEQQNLLPRILDLYSNDPDPGIHGAARWLMKQWRAEEKIKQIDEASRGVLAPGVKRGWSVNGQGQTMVLIPKPGAGWFWMGEDSERRQQPLDHHFTISMDDVTVGQFLQFCKEKGQEYKYDKMKAPTEDCPAIDVSWYEAAEYCNWLSKREGIAESQWCYEPNQDGKYAAGMKIKAGYLKLKGYRLPTEAEWEYACRAGSTAGYSFGESVELLERYGWYVRNSLDKTQPCGMLKPNDLGLFDMHGNGWQWTQSVHNNKVDKDGGELVDGASDRVKRGGSWHDNAGYCRAAFRHGGPAIPRFFNEGFRLARVPVEVEGK